MANAKMVYNNTMKTGGASLYIVIFITMLFGIITLGFTRIMLSEFKQTSDYDFSQSAWDSALAGVEDAKIALLTYHQCLSDNTPSVSCREGIAAMQAEHSATDCDIIRKVLNRFEGEEHETIIQSESAGYEIGDTGVALNQAYTCVRISETTDDYLSTLSDTARIRFVPLRPTETNLQKMNKIEISWFASNDIDNGTNNATFPNNPGQGTNRTGYGAGASSNSGYFGNYNINTDRNTPPTLQVQLVQTNTTFTLNELNQNFSNNTDRGTLMLVPTASGGTNTLGNSASVGFAASADKAATNPVPVNCNNSGDFKCSITIDLPSPARGGNRLAATAFLIVSLPYGQPTTDFSVRMLEGNNTLPFDSVQARVDSTGRANDLFRRVEVRLELVDVYFPVPEFGTNLSGTNMNDIYKNFWVTRNPWNPNGNSSYLDD